MNFSELFKQTSQLCCFSPDHTHLANAFKFRVIVRDVKTLQVKHLFTGLDLIQYIEWSSDSQFILCGLYKRGLVQVWSLEQPEWTCKIDEGSAGLVKAQWSPDGRHILTTSEFHLHITVWSLLNKSVSYIKYPKSCQHGLDFSSDKRYLALAERRNCKDCISLFACHNWQLIKHFATSTEDLAGVKWSPDGRTLCVWESPLQYKILLYSLDGRCIESFSAYEMALGIKTVVWGPNGQFLALASYDEKIRLLNNWTWKPLIEYSHISTVHAKHTVIYKEILKTFPLHGEHHTSSSLPLSWQSHYEVQEGSQLVPSIKADPDKANPKLGVFLMAFSADGCYLCSVNDNMPTCLWIWELRKLGSPLAVLFQQAPIKNAEWDSAKPRLAFCTGTSNVYMWSRAGCLAVQVPTQGSMHVTSLCWHQSGNLLLIGRENMCMCYLGDDKDP